MFVFVSRQDVAMFVFVSLQDADIERMQDFRRVVAAQTSRHRLELMYRSSRMNEDRFNVLLHNNPPPDLNNMTGDESVARYMPSWVDGASVGHMTGEERVARYMPSWLDGASVRH